MASLLWFLPGIYNILVLPVWVLFAALALLNLKGLLQFVHENQNHNRYVHEVSEVLSLLEPLNPEKFSFNFTHVCLVAILFAFISLLHAIYHLANEVEALRKATVAAKLPETPKSS
eukprot:TRINITY_DN9909_c0_g1::TRINITY_DN9909_c0_g1_i1::g.2949::m.2949 TRINITY_DN9909_c0_g1::TRINITY_DN9909_c0_g1_i1::g.2949  ORF type:complete len:116 (+),score=2.96,GspL_C/PF12693.2/11,GspL_C/PF12693.2/1.5,DUF4381/PF14316.1/0.47 TRINITY_DN9909_c0_g1_i1:55-402(+)